MEVDSTSEDAYKLLSNEDREYIKRIFDNPLNALAQNIDLERAKCDMCLPEVKAVPEVNEVEMDLWDVVDLPSDLVYYNLKVGDP